MRRYILTSSVALLAIAYASCATRVSAQALTTNPCTDTYSAAPSSGVLNWLAGQERVCEVRSAVLPLNGPLRVKGENGGIEVFGEDRRDVALEARVEAHAHSQADADSLLHRIRVRTDGTITAEGPSMVGLGGWSVSYRLRVPRHLAAELITVNGGIKLTGVEGDIQARSTNGGLTLRDLAGDIRATTTNGPASVTLAGGAWRGRGLTVQSTNGGVNVKLPGGYSAHLVAQTTNGRISGDLDGQSSGWRHNTLETNVGQGGSTLDFSTTNGHIAFLRD